LPSKRFEYFGIIFSISITIAFLLILFVLSENDFSDEKNNGNNIGIIFNNNLENSESFIEIEGSLVKKKKTYVTNEYPPCNPTPFQYVVLRNENDIIVGLDPDLDDEKGTTFNWTVPEELLKAKKVSVKGNYALYSIKYEGCESSLRYFLMMDRNHIKIIEE